MTGLNSVRKDERGMGAMVIVIAVVVIAVIGLVGWQLTKKKDDKTVASTASSAPAASTVNAACLKVYNDKDLCKFEAASANFDKVAYTAVVTGVGSDGQSSAMTIQSDGKGNTSSTLGTGDNAYSSVVIGNTSYTKIGTATTWTKVTTAPSDSTNPTKDIKTDFSDANTPAAQQIKYVKIGKEACGKQTCIKYQVMDPAQASTTTYVWFGTKDYRLARYSTKGPDGTSDFVITYGPVNIKTPSPVAEAPATPALTPDEQAQIDAAKAAAAAYGQ